MAAVAIRELHLEVCNGEAYNENDYGATSHYQFPVGLLNDPSTKVVGRSLEHRSLDSVRGNMRQKLARNRHRGTQPWAMTETYAIEADGLVVNSRQDLHYESGDLVWVNNQKLFVSDRPKNLSCYVLGNGMSVRVVYSDVLFRPDLMLDGKIYTRFGPPLKCGNYRVICQEPDQLTGTHLTSLAPEDIARAQCLASNPALRARIFRNKLTLHERGFMSRAINASYAPEPSSSPASPLSSYSTASEPGYYPESEPATPRILSLPFHLMGEPVRRPSDPLRSFEQAIEYRLALSGSPRRQSPYTAKAEVDPWFHSAEGSFAWSSDASAAGSWQGEQDEQKYIDF